MSELTSIKFVALYYEIIDDLISNKRTSRDQAFTLYGGASSLVDAKILSIEDRQKIVNRIKKDFGITDDDLDEVIA